ncbi:MAG: NUDIX domain-containing protein [Gammaproteobacteria bacterium]
MDHKKATPVFQREDVRVEKEAVVYQGFVQVRDYWVRHKCFAGGWSETVHRECVQRPPAVGVLLYDPHLEKIVLIEQFRIGALDKSDSPWLLELVAGLVETGEEPADVARRETLEEAGLHVKQLKHMYGYWVTAGASNEWLDLFCGEVDASEAGGIFGLAHEHEDIRVVVMSQESAFAAAADGCIKSAHTLLALMWLQCHLQTIRQQWLGETS